MGGGKMGAMDQHMKAMQAMHDKMAAAKTPEERQALMAEHMKLMQEGMSMMKQMGGMSSMTGMSSDKTKKAGMPNRQQMMEKRMDMMESMIIWKSCFSLGGVMRELSSLVWVFAARSREMTLK